MNPQANPTTKKRDWRRAWQAIKVLLADSSRTEQVFELLGALEGPVDEKLFREFASHAECRKLLEQKPCLLDALSDRERLRALPDGSFGRAYLAFVEKSGIDAEGLIEADVASGSVAERERDLDADRRWLAVLVLASALGSPSKMSRLSCRHSLGIPPCGVATRPPSFEL